MSWVIYQGGSLFVLLTVVAMVPLNVIKKKKSVQQDKFTSKKENDNHIMYMDDLKLFPKKTTGNAD